MNQYQYDKYYHHRYDEHTGRCMVELKSHSSQATCRITCSVLHLTNCVFSGLFKKWHCARAHTDTHARTSSYFCLCVRTFISIMNYPAPNPKPYSNPTLKPILTYPSIF